MFPYPSLPFPLFPPFSPFPFFLSIYLDPSLTEFHHQGTDQEFEEYFKFVRQVAIEDFELCEKAQKNLETGVYAEGILNPNKENGVSFYQGRVKEAVYRQFEEEKREGETEKGSGEGKKSLGGVEGKAIAV